MPEKLRIVFMGTPEFAVASLDALLKSKHKIVGVITAADKPAGRGKKIMPSPVKEFALKNEISPILQPSNLKDQRFIEELKNLNADLQVVVAFRMLPEVVWSMPPKGTINLHASLLPNYRGAAPINRAIINGEKESGATTFFIEKEIDAGNIIDQIKVEITPDMLAGELHDILMESGAKLIVKTVNAIADGNHKSTPQSTVDLNKPVHSAPKIFKEDCKIDWTKNGEPIHNFIRGLSPFPAAWTDLIINDYPTTIKIFRSKFKSQNHTYPPGKLFSDGKTNLQIAVPDGFIKILILQQAGKKRMSTEEFLRGIQDVNKLSLIV
ncbi:MAG: methionyl-tRNA formyltransferase [Bacteroidales bacterium]|nr:methionyl-tRNA formyltransferase [Bacteroidales bacterium]